MTEVQIDYEMQSHLEKIDILERRDKKSGQALSPLTYSWINITCHVSAENFLILLQPEALEWFGLNYFSVPTVVYYVPKNNKFVELIGVFTD